MRVLGSQVQDFGISVSVSRFRVQGFRFGVLSFRFWVSGCGVAPPRALREAATRRGSSPCVGRGLSCWGSWFRDFGFGIWGSVKDVGFRVWGSWFGVWGWGLEFGVWGLGFRMQGLGFRV